MSNVNVVRGAWDPSGAAKTVPSVIVGIKNSLEVAYVADRDERDEEGDFTGSGAAAMLFTVSVGVGRGSSKMTLPGDVLTDVADIFDSFDPEVETVHADLPVLEIVKRTLDVERNEQGVITDYTFKTSLAKHSRTVNIPAGDWAAFIEIIRTWDDKLDTGVAYYRQNVAALEAVESERLAKQAARAAKKAAGQTPAVVTPTE